MKQIFYHSKHPFAYLLALLFVIGMLQQAFPQVHVNGVPRSFGQDAGRSGRVMAIPEYKLKPIDNAAEAKRGEENRKKRCSTCKEEYYGTIVDVAIDVKKDGLPQPTDDGGTMWLIKISSKTALGMELSFAKYKLPPGAQLFIYNEDRSMTLGAFTEINNHQDEKFATQVISGESITVEYYEPAKPKFNGQLRIDAVTHAFLDIFERSVVGPYEGPIRAGECNINVNCPEGSAYAIQKKAVCLITYPVPPFNQRALGSGALINTTSYTRKPYVITAEHMLPVEVLEPTVGRLYNWTFYFNHELMRCDDLTNTAPNYNSIVGSSLLSKGKESDYILLDLGQNPEFFYNVSYLGWDRRSILPTRTAGIHHPRGSLKKISLDNQVPVTARTDASPTITRWGVQWDKGITEQGSSGSPLLSQDGRFIGQLSTGASACNNLTGRDFYGQLLYSWTHADVGFQPLHYYLDPRNTGAFMLDVANPNMPPSCYNDRQDGTETGKDCGGPCGPCVATCTDGIRNGAELGIDCGGPCVSCKPPSCTDGIKNQTETGIDCGGPCAPCLSLCNDGKLNGDELLADCGGSCGACPNLLLNGNFQYHNCQLEPGYNYTYMPFTKSTPCVNGPWYASHGQPVLDVYPGDYRSSVEGQTPSLMFFSKSFTQSPDGKTLQYVNQSDGIYYQFPTNLDPYRIYTMHYRQRDFNSFSQRDYHEAMDVVEWFVASGLKPSGPPNLEDAATWNRPTYPINKRLIFQSGPGTNGARYGTWSNYRSVTFTVPNDSYNQLWIHAFKDPYNLGQSYYHLDDLVLTSVAGYGPACPELTAYTNNTSVPAITEAKRITANNGAEVLSGQNVRFKAANEVVLGPGFVARAGSNFRADIALCGIFNGGSTIASRQSASADSTAYIASEKYDGKIGGLEGPKEPNYDGAEAGSIVQVHPNPTTGTFVVQLLPGTGQIESITVYNLFGVVVDTIDQKNMSNEAIEINLRNNPAGIYTLAIKTNRGITHKKVSLLK